MTKRNLIPSVLLLGFAAALTAAAPSSVAQKCRPNPAGSRLSAAAPAMAMDAVAATPASANGQPLQVMVTTGGKPAMHAHVVISVSDGSVIHRGMTKPDGAYTISLGQGTYHVSAMSPKGKATSTVTIVSSGSPAVVSLALAK